MKSMRHLPMLPAAAVDTPALAAIRFDAVIRTFYGRLVLARNPKKVAVVACMRKLMTILNAMVRTGKSWDDPLPS